MGRLQERVVIITGAGQGIGRGIARRFAREGARIVVGEKNAATGPSVVKEIEELGAEAFSDLPFADAREVFEQVALSSEFVEFLTLPAYDRLT